MSINISINQKKISTILSWLNALPWLRIIFILSVVLSIVATAISYSNNWIVSYGDAESHLNIAKRVVSSLTPGLAQLGGIWLPLPHMLMVPFLYSDFLWRSGIAGSIISGLSFVVASIFIFKLTKYLTGSLSASVLAFFIFATNPNVLYMQSTPMTELPLIAFFVLNSYYFIKFIKEENRINFLLLAALFGFCASLSRYDGWFLVLVEIAIIAYLHSPIFNFFKDLKSRKFTLPRLVTQKGEGLLVLFSTLGLLGIVLWIGWDLLILGDPLYFINSQFSANSQQQGWLAKGQLPSYHNIGSAILYYTVTSMSISGILLFGLTIVGLCLFIFGSTIRHRIVFSILLLVPYLFYVITLYSGQSMIFIPHVTPTTYEWTLFNVRYGLGMIPAVAFFIAYLFSRSTFSQKNFILALIMVQFGLYIVGYSQVMAFADGTRGLSSAQKPDAEFWLSKNYDGGLVLMDDYSRITSIIRSGIPMQNIIYIGTRPYWEESLEVPEKYARWIIMQKGDTVWKRLYEDQGGLGRLYTYFEKVYTSKEILIFRRVK